jgi:hypothetical protein
MGTALAAGDPSLDPSIAGLFPRKILEWLSLGCLLLDLTEATLHIAD